MCDSITFIPHNEQAEEREDFVSFVPGERCVHEIQYSVLCNNSLDIRGNDLCSKVAHNVIMHE